MTKALRWKRVVAAGLLGWAMLSQAQTIESQQYKSMVDEVASALWWGDFHTLQRLHDAWSQPGQLLVSGWSKLAAFRSGMDRNMNSPKEGADLYFVELRALTLQWAREHPQSGLAHGLHAAALVEHAWAIRGSGFAKSVPPEAWADFRRLIGEAGDYLARHAPVALTSTFSHGQLLVIGRASGWNERQLWAVVDDGVRRNPEDLELYSYALTALLPKWGGDNVTVDRYIRRVVKRTRDQHGMSMYARLYAAAARQDYEHALFENSAARWPDMAQGWRDLLSRHPSASTENRYAYFACLARDKLVFLELLDKIGEKPDLEQWGANARRTFDTCRRWAQQQ